MMHNFVFLYYKSNKGFENIEKNYFSPNWSVGRRSLTRCVIPWGMSCLLWSPVSDRKESLVYWSHAACLFITLPINWLELCWLWVTEFAVFISYVVYYFNVKIASAEHCTCLAFLGKVLDSRCQAVTLWYQNKILLHIYLLIGN